MFIIPLAAIFSALAFRGAARARGYHQRRIWTYPLVVGSAFFAASLLVNILGGLALQGRAVAVVQAFPLVTSWTALLLMFAVLAKAWKQLRALPPKAGSEDRPGR